MSLAPLQIVADPRRDLGTRLWVYETFNMDYDAGLEMCTTVIAVVEYLNPNLTTAIDHVREWTVYWGAYQASTPKESRILHTRNYGNKLPKQVAEAMFPRLEDYYYRE
jgi:hypothetical protein